MNLLPARKAAARPTAATPEGRRDALLPQAWSRDVAIILGVVVVISVARATPPLAGPRVVIAWLAALAFAIAVPLRLMRPMVMTVWVCGVCGIAMHAVLPGDIGLVMLFVAIIQSSRLAAPLGPATALTLGLGYAAVSVAVARALDLASFLSSAAGLVFAYLAAASFQQLREEKRRAEALLDEALAGRDAQVRAATLDERARIAREIHDVLAHTLSALAVQLEGTRLLVEQRPGDPAAGVALERASRLARDGLEETKRAVGALRGDALPGPEELPHLVAGFERDTGLPCRLTVEGQPVVLSPDARLALYRTAQEALTNVRKHAAASSVAILLRFGAAEAVLTVEDEGPPHPAPMVGGGHGLEGMRERAELARGRLEAGPTPTGFRVSLWLPT